MGEWKEYKLRDLFQGTKSGDWGKDSPEGNYVEEVTCLRGADIPATNLQEINKAPTRYISRKNFSERRLSAGDLMVEMSGGSPTQSTGRIAYISQNVLDLYNSRLICSNFCKVLQVNSYLIDSSFTYYLWSYLYNKRLFFSYENGTNGLKNLFLDAVLDYESVIIPKDIYEQNKIASQLSEIDNKIAINRKICRNLEAQAQALFKHWFVDFAPFKNGKFVESELGLIPVGWRVGTLSEIADVTMGQSPAGSSYNEKGEGILFYQGRTEFGFRYPSVRLYTTEPKRFAEPLSTLLSVRAPVGDINVATDKCCIGRGLASIKSKNNCHSFIFYLLQSMKRRFDVYNGEGTVFGSINKDTLNGQNIIIPSDSIILEFEEIIEEMDKMILESYQENLRLATLRDTLLPKLMSGEIKVNDIEI